MIREAYEGQIIKVLVGANDHEFQIHKEILTKTSGYFASYLSGRWNVSDAVKPPDPDIDVQTFRLYVHWLYTNEIDLWDLDTMSDAADPQFSLRAAQLAKLYCLGDVLEERALRNQVMSRFLNLSGSAQWAPAAEAFRIAWDKTRTDSLLCKFLVDDTLSRANLDWLEKEWERLPDGLLKQLTMGWGRATLPKGVIPRSPRSGTWDKYHEADEAVGGMQKGVRSGSVEVVEDAHEAIAAYDSDEEFRAPLSTPTVISTTQHCCGSTSTARQPSSLQRRKRRFI